jgi:hypothetical protein
MDPHQQLAALHEQFAQLQAEIQLLRERQPRPKPVLPDPEKFNGSTHRFDTWLPSVRAKLRVDGAAIGDSIAQFYYVFLNLESHVQAMVLPQLAQAEESESWNFNTILDQLSRVCDNPNKIQEAEDKLLSMRQGTDSIPAYISKFERVLYEANGQNWPDINKISIFRNGLSSIIRNRLAQQLNLPRDYTDFVRIVQQLAGRGSGPVLASPTPSTSTGTSNAQQPFRQQRASDPMDVNNIELNTLELNQLDALRTFQRRDAAVGRQMAKRHQDGAPPPRIVPTTNGRYTFIGNIEEAARDSSYDSDADYSNASAWNADDIRAEGLDVDSEAEFNAELAMLQKGEK